MNERELSWLQNLKVGDPVGVFVSNMKQDAFRPIGTVARMTQTTIDVEFPATSLRPNLRFNRRSGALWGSGGGRSHWGSGCLVTPDTAREHNERTRPTRERRLTLRDIDRALEKIEAKAQSTGDLAALQALLTALRTLGADE